MAPSRRGSTSGRGRGRGLGRGGHTNTSNASLPQLPPFIGIPYTPSIGLSYPSTEAPRNQDEDSAPRLPDPEAVNTDRQIEAATTMLQTAGPGRGADVLGQHQQQRTGGFNKPSQDRLRAFAGSIYPQARPSSTATSFCHTSQVSGTRCERASSAPTVRSRKSKVYISSYDNTTQEVIRLARAATVNDMLKEVGWFYGSASCDARKANFKENLYMACERLEHNVELNNNIEYLIGKGLTGARTRAVQFAEPYAQGYLICTDPQINANPDTLNTWRKQRVQTITDDSEENLKHFFLHEHDSEGNVSRFFANNAFETFHLTFWYTQSVSPVGQFKSTYRTTPTPMLALSATAVVRFLFLSFLY
ncbi:hypothetical protein JVT61DRAFT_4561 [Boletus reticuloceps]|uniref:DUF6532 domain-containing protein n=1 Tax=Boletus reticuloceps TaxID=495285 RepID=A0A8I2YLU8_9AGAM|nr:hypothetical protein JVT61DRAFT_4561 [Boletus reticuloceps]